MVARVVANNAPAAQVALGEQSYAFATFTGAVRAGPGWLSALRLLHGKISFAWRFCMGAAGA